jgi:hypothetical protein
MLDRLCAELTRSADVVGNDQLTLNNKLIQSLGSHRLQFGIIPIIVTTAKLHACRFNSADVSLDTGLLPDDATFEEVPYIRYRKSFDAVEWGELDSGATLETIERNRQRSILIVTAPHFPAWLRESNITPEWR